MHLYVAFDAEGIDHADGALFFIQKEGEAHVIDAGGFHDKMIAGTGVCEYGFKTFGVVAYLKVKDLTQVVLIRYIETVLRNIDTAAKLFVVHNMMFCLMNKMYFS